MSETGKASRLLYVIAHPDDEDALSLTYLCRELGAHCIVFSLTRGEGGANLLGEERNEALGFIRTHELIRACAAYGVEKVLFSSAFDYGFSRRLDEARQRWDRDTLVTELAEAIDGCQAELVLSRFSGALEDGHAHHRFCAEVVEAATQMATMRPRVLYGGGDYSHQILPGALVERALAGYRSHRSQDPERLLRSGGGALCHYRERGGNEVYLGQKLAALVTQSDVLVRDEAAELPLGLALPGVRAGRNDSMYVWRTSVCRLQPFASAGLEQGGPSPRGLALQAAPVLVSPGQSIVVEIDVGWNCSDLSSLRIGPSTYALSGSGPRRQFTLVSMTSGRYEVALIDGERVDREFTFRLSDGSLFVCAAALTVLCIDIPVRAARVGYVPGDGDGVEAALKTLGVSCECLSSDVGLDRYNAIIIGERAYALHDRFPLAHKALMDYCHSGGHLIVLSQVPPFDPARHSPWPASCPEDAPEVCEPKSSLRLTATHRLLTWPNALSAEDFANWSGGRGRKFWTQWHENYQSLLTLRDPGQPEQRGAWLSAALGAGHYSYCALNLSGQWSGSADARAAEGALRILANLVSLGSD